MTTFGYNTQGLLATITDPLAQVITRTYDLLGRLETATDPRSFTTQLRPAEPPHEGAC